MSDPGNLKEFVGYVGVVTGEISSFQKNPEAGRPFTWDGDIRLRTHVLNARRVPTRYGLSLGNFELDMEDGEINFKTILQAPASVLSTALLRPYLLVGVETINHYLPGLDKVLAGQETPAAAIKTLETGTAVH